MKPQTIALTLLAGTFAASLPAHADPATPTLDPVRAAFARLLEHAPTAEAPLSANRSDPLLAHLLLALDPAAARRLAATPPTTAERIVAATPDDPLAASFQRMLGHEPTAGALQAAGAAAADPLATLLAARLWPQPPGGRH